MLPWLRRGKRPLWLPLLAVAFFGCAEPAGHDRHVPAPVPLASVAAPVPATTPAVDGAGSGRHTGSTPRAVPPADVAVPAEPATKVEGPWFGFGPYAAARSLCSEHVAGPPGAPHLSWASHASLDAPDKVAAFYRAALPKKNHDPKDQRTFRLGPDITLSIHAVGESFPSCDQKARPGEQTVIVTSHMMR